MKEQRPWRVYSLDPWQVFGTFKDIAKAKEKARLAANKTGRVVYVEARFGYRRPREEFRPAAGLFADRAGACPRSARGLYLAGAGYRGKGARCARSGRFLPGAGCVKPKR